MPQAAQISRRQPRQERSRLTVEAILEGAAQVFERHGYAAGTTNRIAERAGVSIGSLYQYFADKDAILVALVERHVDEGAAQLAPILAELVDRPPPIRGGIRRLTEAMVELHRHRPALHRVLFEQAPRPERLQKRLDSLAEAASRAVAAYLRACPDADPRDPDLAARITVHVIESITHNLVIHPDGAARVDDYVGETVRMLGSYLASSSTATRSRPRTSGRRPAA